MKSLFTAVAVAMVFAVPAFAADKKPAAAPTAAPAAAPAATPTPAPAAAPTETTTGKETTMTGTITCAKCGLKMADSCNTAMTVKENGKDTVYMFDAESDKAHHEAFCKGSKKGTVTGMVTEKDGKKWVKVSKVETAK